jgi:hypothetical protein
VYAEFPYVVLVNGDEGILNVSTVLSTVFVQASTMPSFVNGDEIDQFTSLSFRYPVFSDMVSTTAGVFRWETRGSTILEWDSADDVTLSDYPVLGQGNWTLEMIQAVNFDNALFNLSLPLHDGSFTWFTNITAFHTVLANLSNLFVYANNVTNPTANCVLAQSPFWYQCSPGQTNFTFVNVSEIQQYELGTKSPLYI